MMRPAQYPKIIDGIEAPLAHFENVVKLQPTLLLAPSAVSTYMNTLHAVPKHDRMFDRCADRLPPGLRCRLRFLEEIFRERSARFTGSNFV